MNWGEFGNRGKGYWVTKYACIIMYRTLRQSWWLQNPAKNVMSMFDPVAGIPIRRDTSMAHMSQIHHSIFGVAPSERIGKNIKKETKISKVLEGPVCFFMCCGGGAILGEDCQMNSKHLGIVDDHFPSAAVTEPCGWLSALARGQSRAWRQPVVVMYPGWVVHDHTRHPVQQTGSLKYVAIT